jgi:ADP-heptose:LPS heptosyltransferase
VPLAPRVRATGADRRAAAPVLADLGGAPLAVLQPGATDARRRWPAERFAAVGDALAAHGATVLVGGGPADHEIVAAVLESMAAPARALSVGLGALLAVLERSAVVVGNDTGPLHLAAAVGAPTVALYWGQNAIASPPPWRARHRPLAVLDVACPVCGTDNMRGRCGHDASFIASIPADEVAAAAVDLLGAAPDDDAALGRALDPRTYDTFAPVRGAR